MKPRDYRAEIAAHRERTEYAQRQAGRGIRLMSRGDRVWVVRAGQVAVTKSQQSWRFA